MRVTLEGGPWPGTHELAALMSEGTSLADVDSIVLTHVRCACDHCARVGGDYVDHRYERRYPCVYGYVSSERTSRGTLLAPRATISFG